MAAICGASPSVASLMSGIELSCRPSSMYVILPSIHHATKNRKRNLTSNLGPHLCSTTFDNEAVIGPDSIMEPWRLSSFDKSRST
jgi:hypothetical protein